MKAILVIEYPSDMEKVVDILVNNGYEVIVKKIGHYYNEYKYQLEVSKDESCISN